MQQRPVFELLTSDRVRIGEVELRAHHYPDAGIDEDRFVVEATADARQLYAEHMSLHELRHVTPADLPNGFSMSIERLEYGKLDFKNIHFLSLCKRRDELKLTLTIALYHRDWHLPVSLINFVEGYVDALSSSVPGISAELERGDYGVSIFCTVIVPPSSNLYKTVQDLSEVCLRTYRQCIAAGYLSQQAKSKTPTSATTSSGTTGSKWWVRYVVVPVLGSGAFAAAVGGLIAFLNELYESGSGLDK